MIVKVAQAVQARAVPAPTEIAINVDKTTRPISEHFGDTLHRTSCFPWPCSSTTVRKRADPRSPLRISKTQLSKSPPLRTTTPSRFRADSTSSSRSCAACQTLLQRTIEFALGKDGVPALTQRQGVSPQRTLPKRRASGCNKWRSVVTPIRRTFSKKFRGGPDLHVRIPLAIA